MVMSVSCHGHEHSWTDRRGKCDEQENCSCRAREGQDASEISDGRALPPPSPVLCVSAYLVASGSPKKTSAWTWHGHAVQVARPGQAALQASSGDFGRAESKERAREEGSTSLPLCPCLDLPAGIP